MAVRYRCQSINIKIIILPQDGGMLMKIYNGTIVCPVCIVIWWIMTYDKRNGI